VDGEESAGSRYRQLEARFVPSARKLSWTVESPLSAASLAQDIRLRCELDSRGWERLLWHGGLHIDRKRIDVLPEQIAAGSLVVVYLFAREPDAVALTESAIIFQSKDVVVVNKPAWLTVQGTRASNRISLEAELKHLVGAQWITPAHRLDRQTSGVIIFALNADTARQLNQQFQRREVDKLYWAWVTPPPNRCQWEVSGFMRQREHPGHAFFEIDEHETVGSRASHTSFVCLDIFQQFAFVEARPTSGRTHQIRVHLAKGGTPIVADHLYGDVDPHGPWAERLMLHARSLTVKLQGRVETFVAEPPADFEEFSQRTRRLVCSHDNC